MPLTVSEKKQLHLELRQIQSEVPQVEVRLDLMRDTIVNAQARVDEIERMLANDLAQRIPPADLGE